jgi:hypothetical protein
MSVTISLQLCIASATSAALLPNYEKNEKGAVPELTTPAAPLLMAKVMFSARPYKVTRLPAENSLGA